MKKGAGVPRPERFLAPVLTALVVLLAWGAVAHASGSGFVQAVGALAAGMVGIGMIVPAVLARRLRLHVVDAPGDATSGEPLVLTVQTGRSLRCTPLFPPGGTAPLPSRTDTLLVLVPPYRGQLAAVRVRLATAAPLGLLWWSVDREVLLPHPVVVAPPAGDRPAAAERTGRSEEGTARADATPSGELRQVRAYRHGDSRRQVHWRATAHSGTLMVRESETRPGEPVHIAADLVGDPEATEARARAAMALVGAHLDAGDRVILETEEAGRPLVAPVADRRGAGRRLARAGTNPYAGDGAAR